MTHLICITEERRQRFMSHVVIGCPEDCWIWQGAEKGNGYGNVRVQQQNHPAHRLAYILFVGPIPPGMDVCHHCDIRRCVNHGHLFLGTRLDNMHDAARKGRLSRGERHAATILRNPAMAKLRPDQVVVIRERLAADAPVATLAEEYRVSPSTIRLIEQNKIWKHIHGGSKCQEV